MDEMKPTIRRTHDLSLILQDETSADELPNGTAKTSTEQPEVPLFNDKALRPLPIPSVNILGADQSTAYQPSYSCNLQPPIPLVYSLTETENKRKVEFHSSPPPNTMKRTLLDSWNDRILGRRTRSQLKALPLGSPSSETSQPPTKIRLTNTPNLPALRPISQMNIQKVHSIERLCDNTVERPCRPHPESNSQDAQAVIPGTPQPVEPHTGQLNIICHPPNAPMIGPPPAHQDTPPLSSHSTLHHLSGAISRSSPKPNQLPSIQCLTQSEERGVAPHDMNAAQPRAAKYSQLKPGCPSHPWDTKLEGDGHRSQDDAHSAPSVQNDTGNPNMMYVNNIVQNVYFPSQKHRPLTDAPPHHPPQLSPGYKSEPEPGKIIAPRDNIQDSLNGDGRIYDLAKIRQVGLTVIGGRVYNQQNHPMCAAPRENGIPCKRNVSRSACRWHGSVRILTPRNTMNGLLDNFGSLAHVDTSSNEKTENPGARCSELSHHQTVPAGAPMLQRFTPPRVVARSLRWNNEEHYWFLLGLQRYGHRWSTISKVVRTRDTLQVQSHAQKFFERQNKVDKKKSTIHDLRIEGTELSEVAAKYTAEEIHRRINLVDVDNLRVGNRSNAAPSEN